MAKDDKMDEKEFQMRTKLLQLEAKNDEKKHKYHMEELKLQEDLEKTKFENAKALQRIRSAEINKTMHRKKDYDFMNSYHKNS